MEIGVKKFVCFKCIQNIHPILFHRLQPEADFHAGYIMVACATADPG